ncbi:MAG: hypothetical protein Q8P90_05495 [bacterium]|nr:hypothetical protein [bacterium]
MLKLNMLFRKLMGAVAFIGFFLVATLAPDVPGHEMSTLAMIVAYATGLAMIIIPFVLNYFLGWGWFDEMESDDEIDTREDLETNETWSK